MYVIVCSLGLLSFIQDSSHYYCSLITCTIYCSHNYSQNARQLTVTPDIQRRYAHVVVNLDDVNKQLNARLESIRTHCESLGFSSEVYGSPDLSTMEQAVKITGECNSKLEATGRYVHA